MQVYPEISVILAVYKGSPYLEEAIDSILRQTFRKFELIIVCDDPSEKTREIIDKHQKNDTRIIVFYQKRIGLVPSLNKGCSVAKGKYIARMDADDISYPTRLEKQISFMETHPDYGMIGTWASIMVERNITTRSHKHPSESSILTLDLLFDNPFVQSSMMIRKLAFDEVGGYSPYPSSQFAEDYALWSKIVQRYKVANIPEILQIYRETANSLSRSGLNPFYDFVIQISKENLSWFSGTSDNDIRIETLSSFAHGTRYQNHNPPNIEAASRLFDAIIRDLIQRYPEERNLLLNRAGILLSNIRGNYFRYRYGKYLGRIIAILDKIHYHIRK